MKIIQAIIAIFAIVGCLALALGGYFIYTSSQKGGDNLLTRLQAARAVVPGAEQTTATAAAPPAKNSEYASIIQQYQPSPTPVPAAPVGNAPAGAVGVAPVAQVAAVASAPAQRPISTPKPDEGKIRNWPSGRKWVALTYDDGPHPEWTPKLVELLTQKGVKATFFLLGQEIKRFPDIARSLDEKGFEVGNHTMNHPDFNKSAMTPEKIKEQLQGTNDLIAEYVTRKPINIMRPPYGNTPKKLESICKDMGLQIIAWNIDTDDWRSSTQVKDMVNNIMKNLSDGSIILMHDKHQKTYDTTAEVIDKIRAEGYEFVTVGELLGLTPHTAPGPHPAAAAPQVAAAAQAPAAAPVASGVPPVPASAAAGPGLPPVAPGATGAGVLPVPTGATPVPPAIDESKITVPPPQR